MTDRDNTIARLLEVMAQLRDPETGCTWDRKQTFNTVLPYTIEEVYEVADAIERDDMEALRDELGDLLFQVVFHARIGKEAGHFDFDDVVAGIVAKLVRRHPHVFAERQTNSKEGQHLPWEQLKRQERRQGEDPGSREVSVLDGITPGLTAFLRSVKLQQRAAAVGFDWPDVYAVLDKVAEELTEVREVIENRVQHERLVHELGDLLLAVTNLARHSNIDPEIALHQANKRFEQRFRWIESQLLQQGRKLRETDPDEMEALWQQAKRHEKNPG